MIRALAALSVAALCLLLSACTQRDPEEARLCRVTLVALVARGETPTILRQSDVADLDGTSVLRIDYVAGTPVRRGFVQCRFVPRGEAQTRPDLEAIRTEAGPLSDVSLFLLKRYWLETAEADRADPQPIDGANSVPTLPHAPAYTLQILLNALPSIATYGMLAAAYSLVYGLIGRVNLAFGQLAAVGGTAALGGAALLARTDPAPLILATALAAVWAASLHGVAIARAVFLPLRRSTGQQGLVATVGLALVLDEYLRLAQGSAPVWISPLRTAPIAVARAGDFIVTVTPIAITLTLSFFAVGASVLLLLGRTQFGRNWRAIADDPRAAALMGVNGTGVFVRTFVLAAALAGLSGATVVLVYGSFGTTLGTTLGLKALLAAVLGGIGSVPGAFLGGLTLGLIEAVWSAYYSIDNRDLTTFVILAAALIARPGGLFGYADLAPRRV